MAADPKEELAEGLKHCLWFRGPVLMDHLITLRNEVNKHRDESEHSKRQIVDH